MVNRISWLLVAGLICLAGQLSAEAAVWRTYENPSLGYQVKYPADLFGSPELSGEHGGVTLTSRDGRARLFIFAGPNQLGSSSGKAADDLSALNDIHRVTYRRVTPQWIVLSGYLADGPAGEPGTIFYERIEFNADRRSMSGFRLEYPPAQRDQFDGTIGRIGRSLTPPISGMRGGRVSLEPSRSAPVVPNPAPEPKIDSGALSAGPSDDYTKSAQDEPSAHGEWCRSRYTSYDAESDSFLRYDGTWVSAKIPRALVTEREYSLVNRGQSGGRGSLHALTRQVRVINR